MPQPELMDIKEAAQRLHISVSYLYVLVDRRGIVCCRAGQRILFSTEQIESYLARVLVPAAESVK